MGAGCSLPWSQQPATCLCFHPDESSLLPPVLLLTVNVNVYARITLPSAYVAAQWVEALYYKSEGRRFDS
jgi:hypothetical protein